MPRDLFEEYGVAPPKGKKKPVDVFEAEDIYYPKESKGISGVASDAFNKAVDTAMSIPGALAALPGEIYGAGKQVVTHPKRALQNVGAGFGELGHGILSAPGNVRDYLQKKDLVSENAPSLRLPESVLPKDYNYAEALGAQGHEAGDELLRGLPRDIALAPAARFIPKAASGISKGISEGVSKIMPENAYKFIQKAHDAKESALSDIFTDVSKQANDLGVKVSLPKDLIAQIIKNGPKTDRFKDFVSKAKGGDYDALRKLQSELYTRGKNYKKSELASETDFGDILFEQRAKINDSIIKALAKSQQPELAEKLHGARVGWKELEDLYYANPQIAKLVGAEREVPFTYKPLRRESAYMNKLKGEHPEIEKKLKNARRAKQISALLGAGAYGLYRKGKPSIEDIGDY